MQNSQMVQQQFSTNSNDLFQYSNSRAFDGDENELNKHP